MWLADSHLLHPEFEASLLGLERWFQWLRALVSADLTEYLGFSQPFIIPVPDPMLPSDFDGNIGGRRVGSCKGSLFRVGVHRDCWLRGPQLGQSMELLNIASLYCCEEMSLHVKNRNLGGTSGICYLSFQ